MVCHKGPLLGASMFERVGVVEPWPNQRDPGRNNVTHAAGDKRMFELPTLRNIEHTAPYQAPARTRAHGRRDHVDRHLAQVAHR